MAKAENIFRKEYLIDMELVNEKTLLHFQLAGHMLPIVSETNSAGKITLHEFPGHGINDLVKNYPELSKIVTDKKFAHLVFEYWDRENKRPVAWLYPTGRICSTSRKLESDMNMATHANLEQKQKLRLSWMDTIRKSR